MVEWVTLGVGTVIGLVVGMLIFTETGRTVSSAVGSRTKREAGRAGKYAAKRIRG